MPAGKEVVSFPNESWQSQIVLKSSSIFNVGLTSSGVLGEALAMPWAS